MKRYDIESSGYQPGWSEVEDDDGKWVNYEEAQFEIDRLRAALKMIQSLGEGGGYDMRDMEMYSIAVDALQPKA